jgi:hypothetical protein
MLCEKLLEPCKVLVVQKELFITRCPPSFKSFIPLSLLAPPLTTLGNHEWSLSLSCKISVLLPAGDLEKSLSHWEVALPLSQTISNHEELWVPLWTNPMRDRNHVRDITWVDLPLRCVLPVRLGLWLDQLQRLERQGSGRMV